MADEILCCWCHRKAIPFPIKTTSQNGAVSYDPACYRHRVMYADINLRVERPHKRNTNA